MSYALTAQWDIVFCFRGEVGGLSVISWRAPLLDPCSLSLSFLGRRGSHDQSPGFNGFRLQIVTFPSFVRVRASRKCEQA